MKYFVIIALLPLCVSAALAATDKEVDDAIKKEFPGSVIVSRKECELGKAKVKFAGLVVQKEWKSPQPGQNPLVPVAVQEVNGKLTSVILSKKIDNSVGGDNDFLADFWDQETRRATAVTIKCAVPNKDSDINENANGEFKPGFKDKSNAQHLCFAASLSYNNWACFNVKGSEKIQSSFVQMNAD